MKLLEKSWTQRKRRFFTFLSVENAILTRKPPIWTKERKDYDKNYTAIDAFTLEAGFPELSAFDLAQNAMEMRFFNGRENYEHKEDIQQQMQEDFIFSMEERNSMSSRSPISYRKCNKFERFPQKNGTPDVRKHFLWNQNPSKSDRGQKKTQAGVSGAQSQKQKE